MASDDNKPPRIDEPDIVVSTDPDRPVSTNGRGIQIGVQPKKRARSWIIAACAAAVLFAALAGVLYVATDRGTLEITTSDPKVQVAVTQNGREVTVVDLKTQAEVKLRAGTYGLEIRGENADVRVTPTRSFSGEAADSGRVDCPPQRVR